MSLKRLSLAAAQSLIKRYETEMTALNFQAGEIADLLKDLKKHQATLQKAADKKAAIAKKKAAAIAKKKAAAAAKKAKAAAKKKAAAAAKRAKAAAKRAAAAAKKKATAKKAKPAAKKKAGRPAAKKKATRTTAKKKAGRPAKRKAGRPAAKRKAGRPAAKKTVKKVAAKRKSTSGKRGRKMSYSDWDMLVLNTLKGKTTPTRTADLLAKGTSFAKGNKLKSDEKSVRAKVAASLQKLVNKTKEVKKVSAEGRGFAYKMS